MSDPQRRQPGRRRTLLSAAVTTVLGVGLFLTGALALAPWQGDPAEGRPSEPSTQRGAIASGDTLTTAITALQDQLRRTPDDAAALATLGLDYVQQAKNSADPTYYPKAEEALRRSLSLAAQDNFTALGGMAALENGRHNFAAALDWAQRAVDVNPYNSSLYGALADALTQLGQYQQAADAVQHMVDLKPGTPSLARASYVAELRGDTETARTWMQRALQDAANPGDRAFTHYYLSELAFNSGDFDGALREAEAGLKATPSYTPLLQAGSRAEAALGDPDSAVRDLAKAAQRTPLPEYVLQLGELYQSLGRTDEAEQQYQVFRAEQQLLTDNGVTPDADAALFEADHGDPDKAVAIARKGVQTRPFLESHDALAWALHAAGQDREALVEADRALTLGTRNALFHYHRAAILATLGDTAAAHEELGTALAINPRFHPRYAPQARAALDAPQNPAA